MASVEPAVNEAELPAQPTLSESTTSLEGGPVQTPSGADNVLGTWTCAFCTWQNADVSGIDACDGCEKPRHPGLPRQNQTPFNGTVASEQNQLGAEWSCAKCTFWNQPGIEACTMCQAVPGFTDGTETSGAEGGGAGAGTSDPLNKQPDCEAGSAGGVCDKSQEAAVEHTEGGSGDLGQPGVADANKDQGAAPMEKGAQAEDNAQGKGEKGQPEETGKQDPEKEEEKAPEPVRWTCQLCTFENIEPDVQCQLCTSLRPLEGADSAEVAAQNMCTLCGLIKPYGQPWKGGLCSSCRPVVQEPLPMDIQAATLSDAGPSYSAPEPGPCEMCNQVVPGVLLQTVDGCGHQSCCACLASILEQRMAEAPPASTAAHKDVLKLLQCCELGCPRLLGSASVSCSLPPPAFLALSQWLVSVLTGLYTQPKPATSLSQGQALSQPKDTKVETPSLEPELPCLAEGCPAMGVPKPFTIVEKGDPSCRLWAACQSCPHMTCLACGAVEGVSEDAEYHDHRFKCPLAQTFDVFQALVAFEEAFKMNEAESRESHEDADGRSHKKQKTEQADAGRRKSVWAKGTGYGGGRGEDYEEEVYGGYDDEEEDEEEEAHDEGENDEELLDYEDDDEVGEGAENEMEAAEEGGLEADEEINTEEENAEHETDGGGGSGGSGPEATANGAEPGGGAPSVLPGAFDKVLAMEAASLLSGMSPVTPSPVEAVAATTPFLTPDIPTGTTMVTSLPADGPPAPPTENASFAAEGGAGALAAPQAGGVLNGVPQPDIPPSDVSLPGAVSPLSGLPPPAALFGPQYGGPAGVAATDKRKERKDKEESQREKLQETERQADIRLALAAEALDGALGGDDFSPQPSAGTTALVHASSSARILFAALHRCSLLDMGGHPEREQLYLALLHLMRTLGAHPDLLPVLLYDEGSEGDTQEGRTSEDPTVDEKAGRRRGKGLMGVVVSGITRAFAKRSGKDGEVLTEAEKVDHMDTEGGDVLGARNEERGISADPTLKEPQIVLEHGKSVLSALADLNRQARIVQQGLKNGMVEGENEGDFGVGIVGLVLEVGDCYEELSRRAAHWDSQRTEAIEEREGLRALQLSAQEAEAAKAADGGHEEHKDGGVDGGNERSGTEMEKEEPRTQGDKLEEKAGNLSTAQTGNDEMSRDTPEGGEVEEVAGEAQGPAEEVGCPEKAKTPLKERVINGLKGMLISKKKQKEGEPEKGASDEAAKQGEEGPATPSPAEAPKDSLSQHERIREYKAALKLLQFQEMSLIGEDGQYEHNYRDRVGSSYGEESGSGAHSAKRQLRMLREIAALATTLPLEWESSVHIRVDESRMDLIKAAIIGPEDTPYSNGVWLFDVLLPSDYPERPPKVKFLTTGGGSVAFNPNLYACGKVCLSLLGTWSGPSWKPGKSTLLQVLVSLQSLVFVKEPYYNEPGYESRESTQESEAYNQNVRVNAMRYAILAPLKSPPRAFHDVVKQHFRLKRQEVAEQIDDWVARADSTHKEACTQVGAEIKEELEKLVEGNGGKPMIGGV